MTANVMAVALATRAVSANKFIFVFFSVNYSKANYFFTFFASAKGE